jgi:hypothetical protein
VVANTADAFPSSSTNPHPTQRAERGQPYPMAGHHPNEVVMSPIMATPTRHGVPRQMGGPYHGGLQFNDFNPIPPNQFYGGGDCGSPMVTRGMGEYGRGYGHGWDGYH